MDVVDLAVGDEAVLHADRLEDVGRHVGLVVLPADDLDQATEDQVVGVRVLPPLAGRVGGSQLGDAGRPGGRARPSPPVASVCEAFPCSVEKPLVWLSSCRIVIAPAGWPEKTSRYCETSASRSTSPASTSCITASAVKLLEIEPDQEGRVRRDLGVASGLDDAARADRGDLAVGHDGVGQAGHAGCGHLAVDEVLDRSVGCARRQGGDEAERQGRQGAAAPYRPPRVVCACGKR